MTNRRVPRVPVGACSAPFPLLFLLLFLLVLGPVGCAPDGGSPGGESERSASPMDRLPDDRAGDVVRRAIEFAGGWEAWEEAGTVSYLKIRTGLDEEGEVTERTEELHRYRLRPGPAMRIDLEEDGRPVALLNDGERAVKLVDGEPAASREARDRAWNSTFGSHYVFCVPWKLTDRGARLEHLGTVELPDGTEAEGVRVEYDADAGSAGGMHVWTYYFASDDGRLVANHLSYGPAPEDHSFTEYGRYREIDGIRMPTHRDGYRSNPAGERLRKSVEYDYEEVRSGVPLADSLFTPAGS